MNQAMILQILRDHGFRTNDNLAQEFSLACSKDGGIGPLLRADVALAFRWYLIGRQHEAKK